MKIRLLIITFLVSFTLNITAQVTFTKAKGDYAKFCLNSTLVYIKTGDTIFDKSVESALEDHLKAIPYMIIGKDDTDELERGQAYSFLTTSSVSITYGSRSSRTKGLGIVVIADDAYMLENMITYYPMPLKNDLMAPYMEYAIKGMNKLLVKIKNREIKYGSVPYYLAKQGASINAESLEKELGKGKVLYVAKHQLEERLIEENYKYLYKEYRCKIKVLDEEDYMEMLKEGSDDPNALLLIPLDLGGLLTQVYNPNTKELIYSGTFGDMSGIYKSNDVKLRGGNLAPFSDWMLKQNEKIKR